MRRGAPPTQVATPSKVLPEMTLPSAESVTPSPSVPMIVSLAPSWVRMPWLLLAMAADPAALVPM